MRIRLLGPALALVVIPASAGEPVVVALAAHAAPDDRVVKVEHVATLFGGDPGVRGRMAGLNLSESGRDTFITRKLVDLRLRLAGFSTDEYVLTGADRVTLSADRKPLSADRVLAVAKAELTRQLGVTTGATEIDLAQPIVVTLPSVADADDVHITAVPNTPTVRPGRTQMNVTIKVNGRQMLTLPIILNAVDVAQAKEKPGSGSHSHTFAVDATLVRTLQPVTLVFRSGGLTMTAAGEALQDGKVGQAVRVRNSRSKQTLRGTVTGPGEVELEHGGAGR